MSTKKTVLLVVLGVIVSIVAGLLGVGLLIRHKISSARESAEALCAEYRPGRPISGLIQRARALGVSDDISILDERDRFVASAGTRHGGSDGEGPESVRAAQRKLESMPKGQVVCMAVGFVFLRFFCDVSFSDGLVTEARVTSLD